MIYNWASSDNKVAASSSLLPESAFYGVSTFTVWISFIPYPKGHLVAVWGYHCCKLVYLPPWFLYLVPIIFYFYWRLIIDEWIYYWQRSLLMTFACTEMILLSQLLSQWLRIHNYSHNFLNSSILQFFNSSTSTFLGHRTSVSAYLHYLHFLLVWQWVTTTSFQTISLLWIIKAVSCRSDSELQWKLSFTNESEYYWQPSLLMAFACTEMTTYSSDAFQNCGGLTLYFCCYCYLLALLLLRFLLLAAN